MAKAIGTLGTIDTLTVGGRVFTDLKTLKVLMGFVYGASNYSGTLRLANGVAGYQVTTGKTLTIYAFQIIANASDAMRLLYSDNDVGINGTTAYTNEVSTGLGTTILQNSVDGVPTFLYPFFDIPALKYPGFASGGASTVNVTGYAYEV